MSRLFNDRNIEAAAFLMQRVNATQAALEEDALEDARINYLDACAISDTLAMRGIEAEISLETGLITLREMPSED